MCYVLCWCVAYWKVSVGKTRSTIEKLLFQTVNKQREIRYREKAQPQVRCGGMLMQIESCTYREREREIEKRMQIKLSIFNRCKTLICAHKKINKMLCVFRYVNLYLLYQVVRHMNEDNVVHKQWWRGTWSKNKKIFREVDSEKTKRIGQRNREEKWRVYHQDEKWLQEGIELVCRYI